MFRIVGRETIASGAFLTFERLSVESPDGQTAERFMLGHPGAVAFLPVDGDEVLLVRQYRSPVDQIMLEVPAGKLDPDDDDPRSAVHRECVEEIGMVPGRIEPLGFIYPSGAISDERIDLYWVTELTPGEAKPDGMEEEHAEVVRIPVADLERLVGSGDLIDAKSIATIARYLMHGRR